LDKQNKVAPPAGAWIETPYGLRAVIGSPVAPPAGAWIETKQSNKSDFAKSSRPLRARGLKHLMDSSTDNLPLVAPPAGAWIETC